MSTIEYAIQKREAVVLKNLANLKTLKKELESVLSLWYERPYQFQYARDEEKKFGIMLLERVAHYKLYGGEGASAQIMQLFDIERHVMYDLSKEAMKLEQEDKDFRKLVRSTCEDCSLPFMVEGYAKKDSQRLRYIEQQIEMLQSRKEQIRNKNYWS